MFGPRPPPTPGDEGPAAPVRAAVIEFSADSKTVVFSTFPAKAESDKARKEKKPAPKDAMVISISLPARRRASSG